MTMVMQVGHLMLAKLPAPVQLHERETASGSTCRGTASPYVVTADEVDLTLHYIRWTNGEREVRCDEVRRAPAAIQRLGSGRLRLTIADAPAEAGGHSNGGRQYLTLRQARITDTINGWSQLHGASARELDEGAGLSVETALRDAGAAEVGTRADVLSPSDRLRAQLCVLHDKEDERVPIVAFVVTRLLPLLNDLRAR